MGQYYLGYVKHNDNDIKVFDNHVDGDYEGLKLMEHSWYLNYYVGNVVKDLFYNKGQVCWVGDYYEEDDYEQINCKDKETVKAIGEAVWGEETRIERYPCTKKKVRYLHSCLLVNHTKKQYLNFDEYFELNKYLEVWNEREWVNCIHPLPLLTCTASHSGGSYYGKNQDKCGIWFNDVLEVMLYWEVEGLKKLGYKEVMFEFCEK